MPSNASEMIFLVNDLFALAYFAGGATDDWVDWKVMNSLEGDLMPASPKIEKFILEIRENSKRK